MAFLENYNFFAKNLLKFHIVKTKVIMQGKLIAVEYTLRTY